MFQWAIDASSRRSVSLKNSAGGAYSMQAGYSVCESAVCFVAQGCKQAMAVEGVSSLPLHQRQPSAQSNQNGASDSPPPLREPPAPQHPASQRARNPDQD